MAATERINLYQFCPQCGARAVAVRTRQLVVCGACDFHLYHNPCSATAGIVLDREGRVLLARRSKEPARGKFVFPGGFVDDDETAEVGLRREITEEVGVDVAELRFLATFPNIYPYRGVIYRTLDMFFIARVDSFAAAGALDGVDGLSTPAIDDVQADDLAFTSMRAAWTEFLRRRHEFA